MSSNFLNIIVMGFFFVTCLPFAYLLFTVFNITNILLPVLSLLYIPVGYIIYAVISPSIESFLECKKNQTNYVLKRH